jgi:hypothetical protein
MDSGVDKRKQRGFVPQYNKVGGYNSTGDLTNKQDSVTMAPYREAPTGGNSGGYAKQPNVKLDSDSDDRD